MGLKIRVSTVRFRLWPPLTNQALRPPIEVAFLFSGVTVDLESACRASPRPSLEHWGKQLPENFSSEPGWGRHGFVEV